MHPRSAPLQGRRAALARLQGQRTCPALPQCQQAHAILSLRLRQFTGERGVLKHWRINDRVLAPGGRGGLEQAVLSRPKFRRRKYWYVWLRGESKGGG